MVSIFQFRFGPLRHQWCMRFEAKNHQLKRFVGLNFKNVPKSVASRHQNKMCLNMLSSPGNNTTFFIQRRCYWKRYGYNNESILVLLHLFYALFNQSICIPEI